MMTRGGEGGKKCPKFDDVICERPHMVYDVLTQHRIRVELTCNIIDYEFPVSSCM